MYLRNSISHAPSDLMIVLDESGCESDNSRQTVDCQSSEVPRFARTAGSFSRTPGFSSRTAGAFSHTGKVLQPHGWMSQPRRCFPSAVRLGPPAVPGKCPAMRLPVVAMRFPHPARPEKRAGVRFQPSAVGVWRLRALFFPASAPLGRPAASRAGQAMRSPSPATHRHEAAVLGLRRSSHRAALQVGFAQSDVGWNP